MASKPGCEGQVYWSHSRVLVRSVCGAGGSSPLWFQGGSTVDPSGTAQVWQHLPLQRLCSGGGSWSPQWRKAVGLLCEAGTPLGSVLRSSVESSPLIVALRLRLS